MLFSKIYDMSKRNTPMHVRPIFGTCAQNCPQEALGKTACASPNFSGFRAQFLPDYSMGYRLSTVKIWTNLIIM